MTARPKILSAVLIILTIIVIVPLSSKAQVDPIPLPVLGPNDTIPVPAMVHQNEYVPAGMLEWVWVQAPYPKHLLKKRQEWTRLRNAIYVTYPYARKAGAIMNEINEKTANMKNEKERKKYIKSREKELKKEFADPLSELSVYQGK